MKKLLLSAFLILTFTGYALVHNNKLKLGEDDGRQVIKPPSLSNPSATSATGLQGQGLSQNSTTTNPAPNPAPAATPSTTPAGRYRDGTYTGPVTDAYYGYVQVRATVAGGRITNVAFLQYPNDRRTSVRINSQATVWLSQEAIQAQSANVDIISGATQTSEAFIRSLSAALSQA